MDLIGLIFHHICAGILEKMRGKGGKWVKGAGGLDCIRGSEGLDGQRGHLETIMRIQNKEGKIPDASEQPGQLS